MDDNGHRFNPNKLLLDPYALEVSHDPRTPQHANESIFFSGSHAAADTGDARRRNRSELEPAAGGSKPARPFKDEIVYEVHLRGLTKNDPSIPASERGTYAGAARKAAYLKSLGITAVEFLPLQEFQNDHNDIESTSTNGDNIGATIPTTTSRPTGATRLTKHPAVRPGKFAR